MVEHAERNCRRAHELPAQASSLFRNCDPAANPGRMFLPYAISSVDVAQGSSVAVDSSEYEHGRKKGKVWMVDVVNFAGNRYEIAQNDCLKYVEHRKSLCYKLSCKHSTRSVGYHESEVSESQRVLTENVWR